MIAALFVETGGVYFGRDDVDPWDKTRDARRYRGPHPVVAHPPCERWGRYATRNGQRLGDDGGCFATALQRVRAFGGVLEHPEGSHAFRHCTLPIPKRSGGWSPMDWWGGRSCCVAQGHYGHRANKLTWLYAVGIDCPELVWGSSNKRLPIPPDATDEQRRRLIKTGVCQRLSKRQRAATPPGFADLLIGMARSVEAGRVAA